MAEAGRDVKRFRGLTQDSRQIQPGFLFAAIPGGKQDGRKYIADALRHGATGILVPGGTPVPEGIDLSGIEWVEDDNPRRRLALMAAAFYGMQPGFIAAVTGTNGKTSTVHFVEQLWGVLGLKAATIGTLGLRAPGRVRSASMTTPDPVSLHAELADLASSGITHLAMEASSHGLHQYRLDGMKVSVAAFTNLSRDHLDYHADMDSYFDAKKRLFTEVLVPDGTGVLNADVRQYGALSKLLKKRGCRILSYGHKGHDLKILRIKPRSGGQDVELKIGGVAFNVTLPLVGAFQVMNALCALGLVMAEEPENTGRTERLVTALGQLNGVPGRLQLVNGHPEGAAIYVDYAHTPDALEQVLKALRPHTEGRLFCVFGCGGDRDAGKRPVMGKIADEYADKVIVTDDNPRSENPAEIRKEILAGAPQAQEIGGRREAIQAVVAELRAGDVLLIAGKGHERGQVFEGRTEPFDDAEEAQTAIGRAAS